MTRRGSGVHNDEGAVLVHVAFAIIALIAFTTFVVDNGVFWSARRHAQNAADAAALGAANAFLEDPTADTTDSGNAKQTALGVLQAHKIWGDYTSVNLATDVTFPTCPDGSSNCVRVETHRTAARGNALPIFFGTLVGLISQDVKAVAIAEVLGANSTNCLKPWAVPDLFIDVDGDGEYDAGDTYIPETISPPDAGTGFSTDLPENGGHYGTRVALKNGPHTQLSPGWFKPLDFGSGGNTYRDAIGGCIDTEYGIGDIIPQESGNKQGPTQQGVADLIARDPDAYWDGTQIVDSCVDDGEEGSCPGYTVSPRVVPVPVFDPEYWRTTGDVKVVKILGFFVEDNADVDPSEFPPGFDDKFDISGILINVPGIWSGTAGPAGPGTFLKVVALIR